jgi:soluble lytic murein transglycosylase-like protein
MDIAAVRGGDQTSAALPLRRGTGSGFSETLRAAIRRQIATALDDDLRRLTVPDIGRNTAPHRALLLRGGNPTGPWADLTRAIGAQYLPPHAVELFTRQIALESGNFDPDVISGRRVSRAGAEGIAQLMPSAYPHVNRLDPIASLHAAAATMRDNLLRFGGDMAKALAAYNAGVGAVQQAVAAGGANWRAYLPAETQQYLRLLLGGGDG